MIKKIIDLLYFKLDYFLLLFFVFVSFAVMFTQDNPQIQQFRGDVADVFSFLSTPVVWIERVEGLVEENRQLQEELMRMKLLNLSLIEAQKENDRLHQLLGFKEKSFFTLIPARVINRGSSSIFNSITVNVGREEGVLPNLPVISSQGVVGKTISTGKHTSICQLITDVNFRISVKVQNSRAYGIMRYIKYMNAVIEGIPKTIPVQMGETVITSGYSDIYPIGLEVGKVTGIEKDGEGIFQKVYVECSVDFETLEEVFILLHNE